MRTSIDLDDSLMRKTKIHLAKKGISFRKFVHSAIKESLSRHEGGVEMNEPPVRAVGRKLPLLTNREISSILMHKEVDQLR